MEWFSAKLTCLSELNNIDDKKNLIAEIKIRLSNLCSNDAEQLFSSLDLNWLFSQLTSNDREYTEQVCDALKSLFVASKPGQLLQRYPSEIFRLIAHQDPAVKSLFLKEILRTVEDSQKQDQVLRDNNLVIAIVERISDEDLTVAESAMCIIKTLGRNPRSYNTLFTGDLLRTFARSVLKNDAVTFRIYEVIVDIAKTSKDALEATARSGFLNSLINILENEDILLQLNALEVITQLALTEEGLNYLEEQDVLRRLVQKISRVNEDPLSNLLIPGLMKFFGNVARYWPNEIFSKYPVVASALFEVIESGDQTLLGVALDTLGHVATTVEGKYALEALGDSMTFALRKIAEVIQQMPAALRIRGLGNLARILEVKESEQDNRILSLTKYWFFALCDDPLGMLVSLCMQPFPDIQQAALEVLAVIARQTWGQESIAAFPGLIEFLLDRNFQTGKECKEMKYDIVKCLSQAERNIFDAGTIQTFKQYVQEGAFHVETETEVAVEGAL